jgi:hypothetical protein
VHDRPRKDHDLRRREAAARAEAEELRGRIAELAERLAGVEERLSRLVIARETVNEVLSEAGVNVSPAAEPEVARPPGPRRSPVIGVLAVPPWRTGLEAAGQLVRDGSDHPVRLALSGSAKPLPG